MKIIEPLIFTLSLMLDNNPVMIPNNYTQPPISVMRTVELPTGSNEAYMYESLRPESKVLNVLFNGDQIEVITVQSDIALIRFNGQQGYIFLR